jgi:hypothetical protein
MDMAYSNRALNEQARRVGILCASSTAEPSSRRQGCVTGGRLRSPAWQRPADDGDAGRRRTGRGVTGPRQHAHPEMRFRYKLIPSRDRGRVRESG